MLTCAVRLFFFTCVAECVIFRRRRCFESSIRSQTHSFKKKLNVVVLKRNDKLSDCFVDFTARFHTCSSDKIESGAAATRNVPQRVALRNFLPCDHPSAVKYFFTLLHDSAARKTFFRKISLLFSLRDSNLNLHRSIGRFSSGADR